MKSHGTFDTIAKWQTPFYGSLPVAGERFIGFLPETQSSASFFVIGTAREVGEPGLCNHR